MAYPHYMNMGFGPRDGGNPYMMAGLPMQSRPAPQQISNHIPQDLINRPNQHSAPPPVKSGKRKNGDPNRPKRPTSAYFFFIQLEREAAARRGEKITRVAEWTKQISVKWRALTVAEKVQFNRLAATDKIRYSQQMAAYTGKDANRPKRPQSAYILWLADFRAQMKSRFVENKDLLRAAGEEWRKLTSIDKMPYERRAELEKQKYGDAMKDYNMGGRKIKVEENRMAANGTTSSSSSFPKPAQPAAVVETPNPPPPPGPLQQSNNETDDDDDDGDSDDYED